MKEEHLFTSWRCVQPVQRLAPESYHDHGVQDYCQKFQVAACHDLLLEWQETMCWDLAFDGGYYDEKVGVRYVRGGSRLANFVRKWNVSIRQGCKKLRQDAQR